MKKQVIPALLLLMGMLSSLGVFLFAFPFWDAVLWMLYIPCLLYTSSAFPESGCAARHTAHDSFADSAYA